MRTVEYTGPPVRRVTLLWIASAALGSYGAYRCAIAAVDFGLPWFWGALLNAASFLVGVAYGRIALSKRPSVTAKSGRGGVVAAIVIALAVVVIQAAGVAAIAIVLLAATVSVGVMLGDAIGVVNE